MVWERGKWHIRCSCKDTTVGSKEMIDEEGEGGGGRKEGGGGRE